MNRKVTFSRRCGGFVVSFNGLMVGMILSPENDGGAVWRFISQWGDLYEFASLFDAQNQAAHAVLIDSHFG
jgi:hypothetical protein